MKFGSRLIIGLPFVIIGIWLLYHTYEVGTLVFLISVFSVLLTMFTAWYLIQQYDNAQIYKNELEIKREDLQQIFDSVDATIWSNDIVNKRIYVSKGIEKISGYSAKQFYEDYSFWTSIIHPEDQQKGIEFFKSILGGNAEKSEIRFIKSDGKQIWVHISGTPVFDENKSEVTRCNGVIVDITERKKAEEMLQESESRYRSVVEISPNLILIHQDNTIVYANPASLKILAAKEPSDLIGKNIFDIVHSSQKERALKRNVEIYNNQGGNEYFEYMLLRPNGETVYLEILGSKIIFNGKPAILVVGNDITAKREYKEKIEYMAYHDALTGLPNRHMYNAQLEKALYRCEGKKQKLAILFLDLDHFKFINDTMGHEAGDELLIQVTDRLQNSLRKGDMVFRQGGDEFIILMENIDKNIVNKICENIIHSFTLPFMIKNKAFYTSTSIGICLYPDHGTDKEELSSKADTAMYVAKQKGKNNYQYYVHEQDLILNRKKRIERDLRKALEKEEFYLEYQPKVKLETAEIYGVEALVRWKHPELGVISPNEFIPIAEKSGLIVDLGKSVLYKACAQNKEWLDAGIVLKMLVNVSAIQFEDPNFLDIVKQVLDETKHSPKALMLEITESVMQNISKSCGVVSELKKTGIEIAIDDFGTGYSSLSVLSNITIDVLKIDRSFIKDVTTNANTASLVKTIIEMGKNLNFRIVAEGIETKEQLEFLVECGCYYGQGYFFSPPLSPNGIENLFKTIK